MRVEWAHYGFRSEFARGLSLPAAEIVLDPSEDGTRGYPERPLQNYSIEITSHIAFDVA